MFAFVRQLGKAAKRDFALQVARKLLGFQKILISGKDYPIGPARDNYSLGYIAGCVDALVEYYNLHPKDAEPIIRELLDKFFGQEINTTLTERLLRARSQKNGAFLIGFFKGANETFAWLEDNDKIPAGWVDHASS
jgi:hypothetical protein